MVESFVDTEQGCPLCLRSFYSCALYPLQNPFDLLRRHPAQSGEFLKILETFAIERMLRHPQHSS